MKTSKDSFIVDIGYAGLCALTFVPLVHLLGQVVHWLTAIELAMWGVLAGHVCLLARRFGCSLVSLAGPLGLLLATALMGVDLAGYAVLCLFGLAWVRSAACWRLPLIKGVAIETAFGAIGMLPLILFGWRSLGSLAIGIGCFMAVQSLHALFQKNTLQRAEVDTFEYARQQAERLLSQI